MTTISRVFARKLVQILPVVLPAAILLGLPTTSFAEDELDFSDTAWMIISTPWSVYDHSRIGSFLWRLRPKQKCVVGSDAE